jgi:phage gp36-like protein
MTYCTQQNLIEAHGETELIQLTDRVNGIAVDTVVLATALDKADAIINQRLRAKGWTLPLTLTSTDLQQLAKDIARYYLHGHLSEIPKPVQADFDFAIKTLSEYVKGLVDLDIGSPVSMSSANTGAGDVDFSAPARVFHEDAFNGF